MYSTVQYSRVVERVYLSHHIKQRTIFMLMGLGATASLEPEVGHLKWDLSGKTMKNHHGCPK